MEFIVYLIKSAALLSLFYAVYFLFLRSDTLFKEKRQFLFIGIIAAILLPMLEFTRITYQEVAALPLTEFAEISNTNDISAATTATPSIDLTTALAGLYGIGIIAFTLFYVWQLISLLRMLKRNPGYKKGRYTYIHVKDSISPFSFFNYVVFNPDHHTEEELCMILAHEETHASQWHSLDILFAHALVVLQWANPFAWLYRRSMEENLEFLADHSTVSQITSKKDYQLALVKASSAVVYPMLTNQFYQSFIKKRIVMLNKSKSKKSNMLKAAIILPILAIFLWGFNVKEEVVYTPAAIDPAEEEIIPAHEAMIDIEETPKVTTSINKDPQESQVRNTSVPVGQDQTDGASSGLSESSLTSESEQPTAETLLAYSENAKADKSFQVMTQDPMIRITKNTTKAELEEHKKRLAAEDVEFDYGGLKYNDNDEIIAIKLNLSSEHGNSNYHTDGDEPIGDILIRISEEGVSMGSSEAQYRKAVRMAERNQLRAAELAEQRQERSMELAKRSMERKAENDARMAERNEEIKKQMDERRAEMEVRRQEMKERSKAYKADAEARDLEMAKYYQQLARQKEEYAKARMVGGKGNSFSYFSSGSHDKVIHIDARTTDAELEDIKRSLAKNDIGFKYKKLKRNSDGEITSIHITVDDNKGSSTSTIVKSDDDKAIDELIIHI